MSYFIDLLFGFNCIDDCKSANSMILVGASTLCWALRISKKFDDLSKFSTKITLVAEAIPGKKSNQASVNSISHPECTDRGFFLSIIFFKNKEKKNMALRSM